MLYKNYNIGIEPLPDIDFNIRAGNTLVGFATEEEVRLAMTEENAGMHQQKKILFEEELSIYQRFQVIISWCKRCFKSFKPTVLIHRNISESCCGQVCKQTQYYYFDDITYSHDNLPD